ncbi:ADP-ribosylation factor GTPase activating protein, putative [Trypanosoma brucei gambiense DAL972]|uniref:ADP-ribosylation factor GTPase activating protein, putative n=1 Tax=Trypanosoma brucei gambiense (strain MHOM/CI/86/DAL972) TaxID=679716 RepID=D0A8E3_TRYB9|nr:ADP-ribosylation factor GTPase activating protein, putative [Trypanosoma brucei gambiense DAL972]CBH17944.1 ADP-ribosylation factor GTPase activating protein, putative [Trypanosoma brucei gambiense DAL972]|eukprot:XP_011780208.1 ADP-ribosylation factor GTPase activating protein, putative [Trypanosoma brucei gambiense DAL972]
MSRNRDEVRKLSQKDGNRFCMNCRMRGPVYVVLDFGTFVCSACASLHRNKQHKVKGITMTEFTDEEVARLKVCGNDRAESVWLHGFKGERPPVGNDFALQQFFSRVYVAKEFASSAEYDKLQVDLLNLRGGGGATASSAPSTVSVTAKGSATTPQPSPVGPPVDIFDVITAPPPRQQNTNASATEDDMFSDFTTAPPPAQTGATSGAIQSVPLTAADLFASVPQPTPQANVPFPGMSGTAGGQFPPGMALGGVGGAGIPQVPQVHPQYMSFPPNFSTPNCGGMPDAPFASIPGAGPFQSYGPRGAMPAHMESNEGFHPAASSNQFPNLAPAHTTLTSGQNDAFASLNPFGKKH